jgi:hypothetical protein
MKINKLIAVCGFFVAGLSASTAYALDTVAANSAIDQGIALLAAQQDVSEGGWGVADQSDYVYTAAAVNALRDASAMNGTYYSGLAWLENHHAKNVDLKARKIMALYSHGNNIVPDLTAVSTSKPDATQAGWGLSGGYYQSPLESALVLQAFYEANDATGVTQAISYLVSEQLGSGAWSLSNDAISDAWLTAEVAIALVSHVGQPGVAAALTQAANFLSSINTSSTSSAILARAAHALYKINGLDTTVDAQLTALLAKQQSGGDWGNVMATANAITALAYALDLNPATNSTKISFADEGLRTAINSALGQGLYQAITQAHLLNLTTLDLRGTTVTTLDGLQGALNLTSVLVNANTDTSAIDGFQNVAIVVDSDADNIADASDNCPFVGNVTQTNLDGDSQGDACDADIDGDQMANDWETLYAFNPLSAADMMGDPDVDTLINVDEYEAGTDPRDPDTDGDTIYDGVELTYGLDPRYNADATEDWDSDDLNNADEILAETDLNNPDTDSDGTTDGQEVLVGRNPLLNEPVLIVIITSLLL